MRISYLVHGKRPVTAELALRLGRYFEQNPRYWLNLQSRYDMDVAEDAIGARVAREVQPRTAWPDARLGKTPHTWYGLADTAKGGSP